MAIQKDTAITAVNVTKIRKKMTSFGYDPNTAQSLFITFDQIALDSVNNPVYTMSTGNVDVIPLSGPNSRAAEPLIAAFITAATNMILNEF